MQPLLLYFVWVDQGFNSAIKCQEVVVELWLGSYRTVVATTVVARFPVVIAKALQGCC